LIRSFFDICGRAAVFSVIGPFSGAMDVLLETRLPDAGIGFQFNDDRALNQRRRDG
jgi:hypothetical protein